MDQVKDAFKVLLLNVGVMQQDNVPLSIGKTDSDSSEAMPFPDNFMPNGLDVKFEGQQVPAPGKEGRTSLEIFQNSFRDFGVSLYHYVEWRRL